MLPPPAKPQLNSIPVSRQRVRRSKFGLALVGSFGFVLLAQRAGLLSAPYPDLYEASIEQLQNGLEQGHFTSVDLVRVRISSSVPRIDGPFDPLCRRTWHVSMK